MMTGILETPPEGQRPAGQAPSVQPTFTPPGPERRRGQIALWVVVALLGVHSVWGVQSSRSRLGAQDIVINEMSAKVSGLGTANTALKSELADTRSHLDDAVKRLDMADQTAAGARVLALRNRSEARSSAQRLEGAIEEQQVHIGAVNGTVRGIKTDVVANRKGIERVRGDLSQQSDLITRNRKELDALKQRGGRSYFKFDLRKSKEFTRVGPVSLRLNKADEARQRYTVTVMVADKPVEKKDSALLEPVQFYIPGTHSVLELVAQEIQGGRITGYVSSPKDVAPAS